jgi:hypothetical protein
MQRFEKTEQVFYMLQLITTEQFLQTETVQTKVHKLQLLKQIIHLLILVILKTSHHTSKKVMKELSRLHTVELVKLQENLKKSQDLQLMLLKFLK